MEEAKGIIRTIATSQDPTLVRCFRGHQKTINAVTFCPQMKQVASASADGIVHVWSFKPQLRPFKFVGHIGGVNDVIFNSNSTKIISCGDDREIKFWKNSVKGKAVSVKAHSGPVLKLALSESPSSKFLVSCSSDKSLKMWTLDGKFKQSYLGHTNWVRECEVAHDQRVMLSCSDDRTVKLWDLQTAKVAVTFSDHKDAVLSCKFSPDGTCIAGSGKDGTIKLWDTRNSKLIQHYNAHNGPVNRVAFHPYGYHMTSVSDDGKIKVWELKHGRLGWTLYGHNGMIKSVDFSQKGDYFVSGAQDSLVMIWRSNFDEGLISTQSCNVVPSRAEQINYIEKDAQTLQPLFKSNKIIPNENIHKGLPRFGGVDSREFGQNFGQKQGDQNDSQRINVDPRKKNIAEIMSSGLEKLVNQLDFVTKTIGSLEQRITQHERTVQSLFEHPKVADYLSILEQSQKMKPQIYNSVWQAFRNSNNQLIGVRNPNTQQRFGDEQLEDIAADFENLNKNLSDKKLPIVVLDDGRALRFKEQLDHEEVEFDQGEIEHGQQPGQQF